jgi:osmotically inducible lipoprotein OsmB
MSRRIAKALVLVSLGLAMAGCGYSTGDRAASGGSIGGGIGAVGGAVTSGNDVNLGRPVWC